MRRLRHCIPLCLLALAACTESPVKPPPVGRAISAAIVDGRTSGNAHFYFLPPIGASPSSEATANPNLWPTVTICQVGSDGSCGQVVATFTRTSGTQGEQVTVQSDSTYQVNWDTSLYPNLSLNAPGYRVVVKVGAREMGTADVVVLDNSSDASLYPGDATVTNTQTLPIKFRIEDGALCSPDAIQCYETTLTPQADTVIFGDSVGIITPDSAVNEPVSLIMERTSDCKMPTAYTTYDPCWHYSVNGENSFSLNSGKQATVLLCPDAAGEVNADEIAMYHSEYPYDTAEPLTPAVVAFECTNTVGWLDHVAGGRLAWLGHVLDPVIRVLGPTPVLAAHQGYGSLTGTFSIFEWVRPVALAPLGSDAFDAGTGWTINLSVLVTSLHSVGLPVAYDTVSFAHAGTALGTAISDTAGIATLQITLPTTEQSYTVVATSGDATPVTFSIDVRTPPDYAFHFRPPMGSYTGSDGPFVSALEPTVVVCQAEKDHTTGTLVCSGDAGTSVTYSGTQISVNGSLKQYQTNWAPEDLQRQKNKDYLVQVFVDGWKLGQMTVSFTGKSSDTVYVTNIDNTVPIKFTVEQIGG